MASLSLSLEQGAREGATSSVFRARDPDGVTYALKVGSRDHAATLAHEARALVLAASPSLPRLVAVGSLRRVGPGGAALLEPPSPAHPSGEPALLLEWAGDHSLRTLLPSLDRPAARQVGATLAQGLAALHAAGLAHGDVKPDNAVLDEHHRAKWVDLGLSAQANVRELAGGTPRYLGTRDSSLGSAAARDRLALGVVLAELASPAVRWADDPIEACRALTLQPAEGTLPEPWRSVVRALVCPQPEARASAAWAAERLGGSSVDAHAGLVAATYLGVASPELEAAAAVSAEACSLARSAHATLSDARALVGVARGTRGTATRLPLEGLRRWLLALVGPVAASWPVARLLAEPEDDVVASLASLASRLSPRAWRWGDVERALAREAPQIDAEFDAIRTDGVMRLALGLASTPPDERAVLHAETDDRCPTPLRLAAVSALRRAGELGRACSLAVELAHAPAAPVGALVLAADTLRRAGSRSAARSLASRALELDAKEARDAAGVLARLALDEGDLAQAVRLAGESDGELGREAGALARARTDGPQAALAEAEALAADARTDEARARAAGLLGYLTHGLDLERSLREFERAAGAAAAAGAVLEEATYRTGEAAAAVELGYLERGFDGAERATTLWRALGREKEAARATLATAAALDVLGLDESAERAARAAAELATQGGDVLAAGYAWLAVADAARDATEAREAVERARPLLRGGGLDAEVRLASRELRMGLDVDEARFEPNAASLGASALIEWRSAQLARQGVAAAGSAEAWSAHLDRLVPLARPVAPVGPRARLLAHAAECAARHARPDLAATFGATVAELASVLVARAGARFVEAARRLPWVERGRRSSVHGRAAQARELEELCRALTGRDPMSTILVRAVDALVRWTRVERGLLLLRSPSGELRARAARNLSGADLSDDQLALSRSLAEKALATGEVVVALDASSEQADAHQSAHRLRLRSVLAVPLVAHGEALGVAYLDDRARAGAFGEVEIDWARTIASLAATAIADARDRASLARAAERARRAERALADELARREAELSVATAELERARGGRGTRFEYEELVGDSPPMVELLRALDRVAPAHVPVLVTGESGSGKELVARALHRHGPRSQGPFVSENCGAVPEQLLESALFGHARGAFTGADRARTGLFELAHRGTLFLDEIGEMSLGMQAKLLRVLEDGLVRPVGAEQARQVDVRLVAATHRDLGAMVKARTFREDLYYRIAVITLRVPPLRERASDIPLLASRLLARHGAAHARITQGALRCLVNHAWPGNVRQLDNELRRAAVLSDGVIDEASLSPEVRGASVPRPAPRVSQGSLHLRERLDELEAQLVREALARCDGNQTKAAALLQVSRFGLQKMTKRLGVVFERGAPPQPSNEGEPEPS